MNCQKGGFIHQRHDKTRNIIAGLMSDVMKVVEIEPHLTPLTGESLPSNANSTNEARFDISARSFWMDGQRAFFDVRVFNPFAPSYSNQSQSSMFLVNEREKKRAYNHRIIQVEHGTFSPLVFTPYGMGEVDVKQRK